MSEKGKSMVVGSKNNQGLSLIEILIVVAIFAVIGVLSTRSVFLTVRNANKSDSLVRVRENVNYSLAVIERQLRNAESVTCPSASSLQIDYISLEGITSSFSCSSIGAGGYIASGSARLTSTDVSITNCSLSCSQVDLNSPPVVEISVDAQDSVITGVEKGTVSVNTSITVRNY